MEVYYTINETAAMTKLPTKTIYTWIRRKQIEFATVTSGADCRTKLIGHTAINRLLNTAEGPQQPEKVNE